MILAIAMHHECLKEQMKNVNVSRLEDLSASFLNYLLDQTLIDDYNVKMNRSNYFDHAQYYDLQVGVEHNYLKLLIIIFLLLNHIYCFITFIHNLIINYILYSKMTIYVEINQQ